MTSFFDKEYYGNTVDEWSISLGIIIGSILVGKILYWLTSTVVKKMTAKTRSNLDDLIVDLAEEPVIFGLSLVGVIVGINRLHLSETAHNWFSGIRQFVIIMSLTWLVARLIEAVFSELIAPMASKTDTDIDDQLLPLVRKGSKLFVWSLGTIVALNNAGYNVGALIAGLGIGGLALAMAAQDTVSNVFGGFTVFTDKPFVVSDRVKVAGFDGFITEVGIRSTRLKTLEGRIVTIPNSTFSDSPVENVTLEPNRKVVVNIGLIYDTTASQMKDAMNLLGSIVDTTDGLEENRVIAFDGFGDSAMMILFIYYINKDADIMAAKTSVNMQILEGFGDKQLEMAFPTRTVYTHEVKAA